MNRNEILKNFAIGFIPIFIFIIADEFYDTETALYIGIGGGAAYFFYYLIRYRTIEKFILFDTILIAAMGGISLALEDPIFFKLKPALIEAILVILLGIHAFSSKPILLMMSQRYMGENQFAPEQERMMRHLSRLLFAVFLFHTLLIIYSAYELSQAAWAFISGGLFYILMGLILAGQWIYFKYLRNPKNSTVKNSDEEIFDIVDEKGRVKGKALRSEVHRNPNLIHPVIHLHIVNNHGKIYLQKRSAEKDLYPGLWDTSVGGHVNSGEDVHSALKREAEEELGVKVINAKPLFRYILRNEYESELVYSFLLKFNGPFYINKEEIDEGRFWTKFEIKKSLGKNIFTQNFEQEFAMLEKAGVL